MGWISDRLGRSFTVCLGAFFYCKEYADHREMMDINLLPSLKGAGLLLTSYLKYGYWDEPVLAGASLSAFVAAYCFGTGDSAFNTQVR